MIEMGRSLPNSIDPTATRGAANVFAFNALSFPPRTMPGGGDRINPFWGLRISGLRQSRDPASRNAGYFTAENAVGTSNWLTILPRIWPSASVLARAAMQPGA